LLIFAPSLTLDFRTGNGGAGFDFRFNLSPNAKWAFRLGDGPRTWFFHLDDAHCRSLDVSAQLARPNFIG